MAELRGVDVLQNEIEKSKDKLRGYNENIRKLTGRDPTRPGVRRFLSGERQGEEDGFQNRMARGRGRLFGMARRGIVEDSGPPSKRRPVGGAFSRLGPAPARKREREDSPYEEELPHKLSVHSSVVATSREAKNRDEIMQEQTKDKEGMQRNRRMFGLLLGTLNRFKTESKTLETKDVRRKKIEEKLEEKAEKERKKFKQETKLLMEEMHLEQSKISRLEQKMEMVQEHADREAEMMKLKNFIVTKAKPRIFWKPVQMSTVTENKIKDSKKFVDDLLQEGKDRLDKEIVELMERETKREERIKMRLREDGLLGDEDGEKEGIDWDLSKNEGTERVVVETKDEGESLTISLGQRASEKENDDNKGKRTGMEEFKKPRRTVVVETEESEVIELQEGEGKSADPKQSENLEMEEERNSIELETTAHQEVNRAKTPDTSDHDMDNSDAEEGGVRKQINQHSSGTGERKNSVEEREKRSSERREYDVDKSKHKKSGKEQTNSTREHHAEKSGGKDKHRTKDLARDRSADRDRKKHRHGDSRRASTKDSKDSSRRSRDERREQSKKRRIDRSDSSSDDNRPVKVKKEQEDRKASKDRKKSSKRRSDDSDDDDKEEKESHRKVQIERANNSEKPDDGNNDEQMGSEENGSEVVN